MDRYETRRRGERARRALSHAMRGHSTIAVLSLALLAAAPAATACGYCVEDKIASVYDYAVVTGAAARRHHIAIFALEGPLAGGTGESRALERIASGAHGVDAGSARANAETATLAVAFDPAAVSFGTLHRFLQRKFTPRGLSVLPIKVMETATEFKPIARR